MPAEGPFCVICGFLTIYRGRVLPQRQLHETANTVVYETTITATSGSTMSAKLLIVGRELYPDGVSICVIAGGGPLQPYGYLLHVLRFIPHDVQLLAYTDSLRFSRLSTSGKVVSQASRNYNSDVLFDLEVTSNIQGNFWTWTIRYEHLNMSNLESMLSRSFLHTRCVIRQSRLVFVPAIGIRINVFGLVNSFLSECDHRKLDLDILTMSLCGS